MISKLLHRRRNPALHYAVLGIILIALFLVGLRIGDILGQMSTNPPDASLPNLQTQDPSALSGGARVDPPYLLTDFTLTSQKGTPLSLSDLRGKAVLFFFGYTHCPDVCPNTLSRYTDIKKALGSRAENVAFVFISVDGQRDTPSVMADYLDHFDNAFIGLTGSEAALEQLGKEYGLYIGRETINVDHEHAEGDEHNLEDENYFVQHTSPSFLVDPEGYLRMVYFYGTETETIAAGIETILQ